MKIPGKNELLKELDVLSHKERNRRMASLGREGIGNPGLKNLLDELERGDNYEQRLALMAAATSRDAVRIRAALRSPSVMLRNLAVYSYFHVIEDYEHLTAEIYSLPLDTRRRLLAKLGKCGKQELADRLFPLILKSFGSGEAARMLWACSSETVTQNLPAVGSSLYNWGRMAKAHCDAVLTYIRNTLAEAPVRERMGIWNRFHFAVLALAEKHPGDIIRMAQDYYPSDSLPACLETSLGVLTRKEPGMVYSLITRPAYMSGIRGASGSPFGISKSLPRPFLKEVRHLGTDQIASLAKELAASPIALRDLLESLKPSVRGVVFDRACENLDMEALEWPLELLEILPSAIRRREAQRMRLLRSSAQSHERMLELLAMCDIDDARPELCREAESPDAEKRAKALCLLIKSTALDRKGVGETLRFLERIKNDQDPVRLAVFQSLAKVPPMLFEVAHLGSLGNLTEAVFQARDTSPVTRNEVRNLAARLLTENAAEPEHPLFTFSIELLRKLTQQAGTPGFFPALWHNLPRQAEHKIVEALTPLIQTENKAESYALVTGLARALGKRAWNVKPLQKMLEPVIQGKPDHIALTAMDLWLDCPVTRDERVRTLVARDKSSIVNRFVLHHIHTRRQELLDGYLSGRPVRGKFLTGQTIYLLPVAREFYRWLPRQEEACRKILRSLISDKKRTTWERVDCARRIARMASSSIEDFRDYLKDEDVNIVEASLGAISRLDDPGKSLPILFDNLDSDRARVAMYAIPRCLRSCAPEKAREMVLGLLTRQKLKVTVHKELVRILGAYRLDGDCSLLQAEWKKAGVYRDVRIAVVWGARMLLEAEKAWEILEEASSDDVPELAQSLLDQTPVGLLPWQRARYGHLLVKVASHNDKEVRKSAFSRLGSWTPGLEAVIASAARERILDIENGSEWREALSALLESCRDGKAGAIAIEMMRSLAGVPVSQQPGAGLQRDLPYRQRLHTAVESFAGLPWENRMRIKPLLQDMAAALSDPALWPLSAMLQVAAIPWDDPGKLAETLKKLTAGMGGNHFFLGAFLSHVAAGVRDGAVPWSREGMIFVISSLLSTSEANEHLALVLLKELGVRLRWDDESLKLLKRLRSSCYTTVKAAASGTWTCAE